MRFGTRVVFLWAAIFGLSGFVLPGPVLAHTAFESSMPADGEFVDGMLSEVVVLFSAAADPVGDGFQVVLEEGLTAVPHRASSSDGRSWRLVLAEPVDAGRVGVRWKVQAPDAHPIEGSFSFVVVPPVPAPSGSIDTAEPAPTSTTATTTTATTAGSAADVQVEVGVESAKGAAVNPSDSQALDEFLEVDGNDLSGAGLPGLLGRVLVIGGTLLAIGSLMFAAAVLDAGDPERRLVVGWVAVCGVVVAAGATLPSAGRPTVGGSVWFTTPLGVDMGLVSVLRGVGGLLLAVGVLLVFRRLSQAGSRRGAMELVAAGRPTDSPTHNAELSEASDSTVGLASAPLLVGLVAVGSSFVFDGHTVTEGNRLATGAASLAHVFAGGVWAGGVVALGGLLWLRHRQQRTLDALRLGVRFSVIATVAVGLAGLTGIGLGVTILDSASEIWSTAWGRVLLAKSAVVAVAVCIGAYNHYSVVPSLVRDSDSARLRRTVRTEAFVLLAVVVLTAILVTADSTGSLDTPR